MSIEALNAAFKYQGITPSQKLVLLALANYADEEMRCFPGLDRIARDTCLSRSTVIRTIKSLSETGIIEVEKRGGMGDGRASNRYRIIAKCHHDTPRLSVTMTPLSVTMTPEPSLNHQIKEKSKPKKKVARFKPPSPEEVTEYARTIGFNLDGNHFVDYYEARGWRLTRTPMKDWKAAVRTWKGKQNADHKSRKRSKSQIAADACFGTGPEDILAMGEANRSLWPEMVVAMGGRQTQTYHAGGMEPITGQIQHGDHRPGGGVVDRYLAAYAGGHAPALQTETSSTAEISGATQAGRQRGRDRSH